MHNPFVFGQPIEETETDLFVGRRDTGAGDRGQPARRERKPTLVLWGPRRMGKTSVLLQLPRLLGQRVRPGLRGHAGDAGAGERAVLLPQHHRGRRGVLHRRGSWPARRSPLEELAAEPLRRLLRLDQGGGGVRLGRAPPAALPGRVRAAGDLHPRGPPAGRAAGRDSATSSSTTPASCCSSPARTGRTRWSSTGPTSLISTKLIRVGYLSPEEAPPAHHRPRARLRDQLPSGERWSGSSPVTRRQPYLVQALCYELVNYLNVENRREATLADVELATVQRALESAHLYFAEMWRQLDDEQRALVRTVAASPEGVALAGTRGPHLRRRSAHGGAAHGAGRAEPAGTGRGSHLAPPGADGRAVDPHPAGTARARGLRRRGGEATQSGGASGRRPLARGDTASVRACGSASPSHGGRSPTDPSPDRRRARRCPGPSAPLAGRRRTP